MTDQRAANPHNDLRTVMFKARDMAANGELPAAASMYAAAAHGSQARKYTGKPYMTHCIAVAEMVKRHKGTPEMIAAAYLHDTVEDTATNIDDILQMFGETVATYVLYMTSLTNPLHGNRATRKHMDALFLGEAPDEVDTIKACDLIHNSQSIMAHDPKFAKVFIPEMKALFERHIINCDPDLYDKALEIFDEFYGVD